MTFSIYWSEYRENFHAGYKDLLASGDFYDLTLAVQGKLFRVHKLVISMCSPFFRKILREQNGNQPVVIALPNVEARIMEVLLEYMYCGEARMSKDDIGILLETSELLQIKGLFDFVEEPPMVLQVKEEPATASQVLEEPPMVLQVKEEPATASQVLEEPPMVLQVKEEPGTASQVLEEPPMVLQVKEDPVTASQVVEEPPVIEPAHPIEDPADSRIEVEAASKNANIYNEIQQHDRNDSMIAHDGHSFMKMSSHDSISVFRCSKLRKYCPAKLTIDDLKKTASITAHNHLNEWVIPAAAPPEVAPTTKHVPAAATKVFPMKFTAKFNLKASHMHVEGFGFRKVHRKDDKYSYHCDSKTKTNCMSRVRFDQATGECMLTCDHNHPLAVAPAAKSGVKKVIRKRRKRSAPNEEVEEIFATSLSKLAKLGSRLMD